MAGALRLDWQPNPEPDISHYRLRFGTKSGVYDRVQNTGKVPNAVLRGLAENTRYYFVVTAVTRDGVESPPSQELSFLMPRIQVPGPGPGSGPVTGPTFRKAVVSLGGFKAGSGVSGVRNISGLAKAHGKVSYSKVSGPAWLRITRDGRLVGVPPIAAVGGNQFTIRATDASGRSATSKLVVHVKPTGVRLPWSWKTIGVARGIGDVSQVTGSYRLRGAGGMKPAADVGSFAWQTVSGDAVFTARVSPSPKDREDFVGGIMIRESLAPNAKQVFIGLNGRGTLVRQQRDRSGGRSVSVALGKGFGLGTWVRLVRSGDTVTVLKSGSGVKWTRVGSVKINFRASCYYGMFVTGGGESTSGAAIFRNVLIRRMAGVKR